MDGLGKSPYAQSPTQRRQARWNTAAIDTEKPQVRRAEALCGGGCGSALPHTWFADTIVEQDVVRGIIVENKSGRQALLARVVVDASGDGDVAAVPGHRSGRRSRTRRPD